MDRETSINFYSGIRSVFEARFPDIDGEVILKEKYGLSYPSPYDSSNSIDDMLASSFAISAVTAKELLEGEPSYEEAQFLENRHEEFSEKAMEHSRGVPNNQINKGDLVALSQLYFRIADESGLDYRESDGYFETNPALLEKNELLGDFVDFLGDLGKHLTQDAVIDTGHPSFQ